MNDPDGAKDVARPPAGLVDIVTVNWNAQHQLGVCIASVLHHDDGIVRRMIVVDNGSRDGSADLLPVWSKLVVDKTEVNLGFGRACNRGAAQGDAPFVLFLNPDTELTEPAISKALTFLQSEEGQPYAVCGIKLIDEAGHATRHCARFPNFRTLVGQATGADKLVPRLFPSLCMAEFDHLSSRPVDHVQGAFYLIRRTVFEQVGGFDEDYFVYLEDLDLSLKVRRAGFKAYYLSEANAFHRGGGTSGQVKGIARFYSIEARLLYARKHFGGAARRAHASLTYLVEPVATTMWHLGKYRGVGFGGLLEAFVLLARHTPGVLRGSTARRRGEEASAQARRVS